MCHIVVLFCCEIQPILLGVIRGKSCNLSSGGKMTSFTIIREIESPVEKVWDIVGNFMESPGPGITVTVEEKGDHAAGGVGAVREITIGKVCVRERLESINPPHSFSYRVLSGAPMKDYLAHVEFSLKDNTTIVQWKVELTPKIPLTGWICCKVSKGAVNSYLDEVENAANKA